MSRVAGSLIFAMLAPFAAPAGAADIGRSHDGGSGSAATGYSRGLEGVGGKCRGPRVEIAHYKEQVCHRGVAGYAECRWVNREHEVHVPAACEPRYTVEDARPADRGAFPPFPRLVPRG